MIGRIKQGLTCLFSKYDKNLDEEVRKEISESEFFIFNQMDDYDKVHSFSILERVKKDTLLNDKPIYRKLALLHDCGKGRVTVFRRVKKVLFGDVKLETHPEIGYKILRDINLELAKLCREHHNISKDECMKRFQKIDDM
ncbi:MAG: HD domain-containing protein [Cetobacterium sp.]|uniref:HD domain-containing protein n=1 Tax=unclassified Cetobacterium TaxID=2630983 RepID=UPI00163BF9A8|nr:HD domain-containing protein [Cetobacterium sp. 2A]MBC2856027.1 HD domain-containing protein [Cetobacterium sp. 2A]